MSMLGRFLEAARADRPVYICEVRDAFQREGARDFIFHAVLYDGGVRRFALKLPACEGPEEDAFVEEYLTATLYNLLSALGAREICPAPITEAEARLVGEAAVKVHEALGLSVYSRADFILDGEGRAWCLEVNTLPGMTPNSLIPKAAAIEGLSYAQLCEKIVELSLQARKNAC